MFATKRTLTAIIIPHHCHASIQVSISPAIRGVSVPSVFLPPTAQITGLNASGAPIIIHVALLITQCLAAIENFFLLICLGRADSDVSFRIIRAMIDATLAL